MEHPFVGDEHRADDRNAHAVAAKFLAEAPREADEPMLSRRIHGIEWDPSLAGHRRDVDDVPFAPFDHPRSDDTRQLLSRDQVRSDDVGDVGDGIQRMEFAVALDAGIVDEYVRRAKLVGRSLHQVLEVLEFRDVGGDGQDAMSEPTKVSGDLVKIVLRARRDREIGSTTREALGERDPQSARRSSDDRYRARYLHRVLLSSKINL
jgi:hypothetical protein